MTEDKSLVKSEQHLRLLSSRRQPPLLVRKKIIDFVTRLDAGKKIKGRGGGNNQRIWNYIQPCFHALQNLRTSGPAAFPCSAYALRMAFSFLTVIFIGHGFFFRLLSFVQQVSAS